MAQKICMISLGCAKNLVNSEQMLYLLSEAGYELKDSPEGADAAIINTCGFIESAVSEAIDEILVLSKLKEEKKLAKIIVCGCLPERYREDILPELPEIDAILGVGSFSDIVAATEMALKGETPVLFGDKNAPVDETKRILSTPKWYAYLKIAEGCDNRCAFCVIPEIRGRFRSRPLQSILAEARELADSGVRELIVVAQDITRYGCDLYGKRSLVRLLCGLAEIKSLRWIRLHYLYPNDIDDELIDLIATEDKIVKYLDIPLQHVSDAILSRMNRRGTKKDLLSLIEKLRAKIPGLVLRTSLIAGLPGEGEAEFEELSDFLLFARIERTGVFVYSPEDGTRAADMPDRPERETAEKRAEQIMEIQSNIMQRFGESLVGTKLEVICEGRDPETGLLIGRSFADSPDVDGAVFFEGDAEPGDFLKVLINETRGPDLYGAAAPD